MFTCLLWDSNTILECIESEKVKRIEIQAPKYQNPKNIYIKNLGKNLSVPSKSGYKVTGFILVEISNNFN